MSEYRSSLPGHGRHQAREVDDTQPLPAVGAAGSEEWPVIDGQWRAEPHQLPGPAPAPATRDAGASPAAPVPPVRRRRPRPWPVPQRGDTRPNDAGDVDGGDPGRRWQPALQALADMTSWRPAGPPRAQPPDRLADRLFLACHNAAGKPVVKRVGLGLAAGLLGELALSGHLTVTPDRGLVYPHSRDVGEPAGITADVWQLIRREPPQLLRDWIVFTADGVREQLGRRLVLAGFVTHQPPGRLRGQHRWPPRLATLGIWLHDRAEALADGRESPTQAAEVVLVALAYPIGLVRHDVPDTAWDRLAGPLHGPARDRAEHLRSFCTHAQDAIAALATARR